MQDFNQFPMDQGMGEDPSAMIPMDDVGMTGSTDGGMGVGIPRPLNPRAMSGMGNIKSLFGQNIPGTFNNDMGSGIGIPRPTMSSMGTGFGPRQGNAQIEQAQGIQNPRQVFGQVKPRMIGGRPF